MNIEKMFEGNKLYSLWNVDGKLEASPGCYINDAVDELVSLSRQTEKTLEIDFNGITVTATPESFASDVVGAWNEESNRRAEAYRQELKRNPPPPPPPKNVEPNGDFKLAKPHYWATALSNQKSAYGQACFSYAERWARKIQHVIDTCPETPIDEVMKRHAERLSHDADVEGITGFMYGCAVSALASCWEHGDALRRWHNLSTQIGDEGERANESGGVINPALITISTK